MAHLTGAEARKLGHDIVMKHPGGIMVAEINRIIGEKHPEMVDESGKLSGTVRGATWNLEAKCPDIVKLADGRRAPRASDDAPTKPQKTNGETKKSRQTFARCSAGERAVAVDSPAWQTLATSHGWIPPEQADAAKRAIAERQEMIDEQSRRYQLQSAYVDQLKSEIAALKAGQSTNSDSARLRAAMKAAGLDAAALARKLGFNHRAAVADVLRAKGPRPLQGRLLAWVEKQEQAS